MPRTDIPQSFIADLTDTENCSLCVGDGSHQNVAIGVDNIIAIASASKADSAMSQTVIDTNQLQNSLLEMPTVHTQPMVMEGLSHSSTVTLPIVQDIQSIQNMVPNLSSAQDTQPVAIPMTNTTPKGDNTIQTVTALPILQTPSSISEALDGNVTVQHYLITKVVANTPDGPQIKSEILELTPGISSLATGSDVVGDGSSNNKTKTVPENTPLENGGQNSGNLTGTDCSVIMNPVPPELCGTNTSSNLCPLQPSVVRLGTDMTLPGTTAIALSVNSNTTAVENVPSQGVNMAEVETRALFSELEDNQIANLQSQADGLEKQENLQTCAKCHTKYTPEEDPPPNEPQTVELTVRTEHIPSLIAANPGKPISIIPTPENGGIMSRVKITTEKGLIELPYGKDGQPLPILSCQDASRNSASNATGSIVPLAGLVSVTTS